LFVFCLAVAQKAIAASIFNNWLWKGVNMFSQLHYSPYFAPAAFYLYLKVKSELASCLLTQGTFKKSSWGVAPTITT
jgi:hypothetical protein